MEGNANNRGRKRVARGNDVMADVEEKTGKDSRALRPQQAKESRETDDLEDLEASEESSRTLRPRVPRHYGEMADLGETSVGAGRASRPKQPRQSTGTDDLVETSAGTGRASRPKPPRQHTEKRARTSLPNRLNNSPMVEDDDDLQVTCPGTTSLIHKPWVLEIKEEQEMDAFEDGEDYPEQQQQQRVEFHQPIDMEPMDPGFIPQVPQQQHHFANHEFEGTDYYPMAHDDHQQYPEAAEREIQIIDLDDDEDDEEIQFLGHFKAEPADVKEEPMIHNQHHLHPVGIPFAGQLQYAPQFHQQHLFANVKAEHFHGADGFQQLFVQEEPVTPRKKRLLPEAADLTLPGKGTIAWENWTDEQVLEWCKKIIKDKTDQEWLVRQSLCVSHIHKLVLEDDFYVKMGMNLSIYVRLQAAFHKILNMRNGYY